MKRSSVLALVAASALLYPALSFPQTSDFTLNLTPTVSFPLGPIVDGDLPLFDIGGGGSLSAEFAPAFAPFLFAAAAADADFLPLNGASSSLTLLAGGAVLGASLSPVPRLALRVSGGGGIYAALAEAGTVSNPFLRGGGELELRINPTISMKVGASYKYLFTPTGPLYQGISATLGLSYNLAGSRKGTALKVDDRLNPIFPLFYTYYDKHPAGELILTNPENAAYEHVRVSFYSKQYMDGPRLSVELDRLAGGESRSVSVYALFNDSIFKVTEGTKAAGEILVDYYYMGAPRSRSFPVTVTVQNRNAMTWDDDRKAAAFVTAKDPLILAFAKNVASVVRYQGAAPVSENFRTGMSLFQALTLYGIGYAADPRTPYATFSGTESSVDFLQFPGQTLAYRGGDCDDLSVLYCALLESVGVSSALVTTPGHIFVAFDAGVPADQAAALFPDSGELIVKDGVAWVPVEVTAVKEGFVRAWNLGSQEWREAEAAGSAAFYPVQEAWKTYEPVGFAEGVAAVVLPAPQQVTDSYSNELRRFLDAHVAPLVADLQIKSQLAGKRPEQIANKAGVLYARFGALDEAAGFFRTAAKAKGYVPALTNLGNVYYLKGDMKAASGQYGRALALAPQNTLALAGVAKVAYAQQDYKGMDAAVAQLKAIDPALAASLDVKGGAVTVERAADADAREVASWED